MIFHEAIAQALRQQGIVNIFGVLGDANLFMMESFERVAGGTFYSMVHESGALLAANGYARTSGHLGVASVTHGPGLTNTVTALVESVKDHTPILLVAGDTAVVDRENIQSISQRDLVLSTGAGFEQVRSPHTVAEDVAVAVRRALFEHRPIVLNVPVDFQWLNVEVDVVSAGIKYIAPQPEVPNLRAVEDAVAVIAAANRPIVVAGQGAASPEHRASLIRFAHRIGAALATSLSGYDLFRGDPHNLGIYGTLAEDAAVEAITQADTIIAFGASLNKHTTAAGALLAGKNVIHVDNNRAAIEQYYDVSVGVVGDAALVADAFVSYLDEAEVKPTGFASPHLAEKLATRSDITYSDVSTDQTVDVRTAFRRIDSAFTSDRTFVLDGGRFMFEGLGTVHSAGPHAFLWTTNFGSIGLSMGNAVGAFVGAPERPVLLVTGDGGFMLGGLTEFNSAVRHGIDLVVVLINDGAYGAEHIQLRSKGMDPAITTFEWPDFAAVAESLGGRGHTVRTLTDLDAALAATAVRDRPVLIDIRVDPDLVPMPEVH